MDGTTCYLNTDLELTSTDERASLVSALELGGIAPLHVSHREDGLWFANFETIATYSEPEPNIAAMLTSVESLSEPQKSAWWACDYRQLNIGYDGGTEPSALTYALSSELLRRAAEAGLSLAFTLYAAEAKQDT